MWRHGVAWPARYACRSRLSCPAAAAPPLPPQESFVVGVEREAGDPRPATPMMGANQWPREEELPGACVRGRTAA